MFISLILTMPFFVHCVHFCSLYQFPSSFYILALNKHICYMCISIRRDSFSEHRKNEICSLTFWLGHHLPTIIRVPFITKKGYVSPFWRNTAELNQNYVSKCNKNDHGRSMLFSCDNMQKIFLQSLVSVTSYFTFSPSNCQKKFLLLIFKTQ